MHSLKIRQWIKIFHANSNQKSAEVAMLISEKIDFKSKTVKRNKAWQYTMICVNSQGDITVLNICAHQSAQIYEANLDRT